MENERLERIKKLRENHGYTQTYTGRYLGLTQAGYSKIEKGIVRLTDEVICELSELYGVSTDYILLGKGDKTNEEK